MDQLEIDDNDTYRVGHKKPTPHIMLFILHVYMFSCTSNIMFQFLHKKKSKLDKCVKILNRYIEAPQKRFYTTGKYISHDVFGLSRAIGANNDDYKAAHGRKWPVKW